MRHRLPSHFNWTLPSLRSKFLSPSLRQSDFLHVLKKEWKVTLNCQCTGCLFVATPSTAALPHRKPPAGAPRDSCCVQYGDNRNILYLSAKPHGVTTQSTVPNCSYSTPSAPRNSFIAGYVIRILVLCGVHCLVREVGRRVTAQ